MHARILFLVRYFFLIRAKVFSKITVTSNFLSQKKTLTARVTIELGCDLFIRRS